MITLISISYNSKEAITACLAPVLDHKNFPSIIVDNASSDGSADVLQTRFPRSEVIKLPKNIGYGRAANIALARVKTPYAMLLNPDLHATPELIEKLLVHAQNANQAAIIAPTVKTKDLDRIQSGPTRWVSGAAMLFNMALMKNVGWFDENIFLFSEETDLCRRTRAAGYEILRIQDIYMQHLKGKSSLPNPQVEYMKNWHVGWSHAYYCTKHNLAIGKSHPARSIIQYRIKACFAFDSIKRTKYTARADGISAFLAGEKAFLPDGTPQASPATQNKNQS